MRSPRATRLRRRYINREHPLVVLRFEDGHEIRLRKGEAKEFDAFAGETIRIVAVWDSEAGDRETLAVRKGEDFEKA